MSYPDPDCYDNDKTPHLDAMAIGFGFWCGAGLIVQIWHSAPAWVFVLGYCAVGFWLTGWVLKGIWRGAKWFWRLLGRLEIEP